MFFTSVLSFLKKLPKYQNTIMFKYYCTPEFVYLYQATTSLSIETSHLEPADNYLY